MSDAPASPASPPSRTPSRAPSRFADLQALVKPRITRMVVLTAAVGFKLGWDATRAPGAEFPWVCFALALLGTALACMGASALNQEIEHDTDALMERTRQRPVAAGRLSRRGAFVAGLLLSLAGCAVVALATRPWLAGARPAWIAAAVTALTVVLYAWVYTPLKRRTTLALLVGTLPGATPPMIGFAAAWEAAPAARADMLHSPGFWLPFVLMVVWQVPHFLAIAWLYREDYARGGLKMLPVVDPSGERTFRQILIGCLLLLPIGLAASALGLAGWVCFAVALLCGLGFLGLGIRLVAAPTARNARILFFASLVYLPLVLAALLVRHP